MEPVPSPTGAHPARARPGARGGGPAGAARSRTGATRRARRRRRAARRTTTSGSTRSSTSSGARPRCSAARRIRAVPRETAGRRHRARRGPSRLALVEPGVDHRARELRVVGPRPAVEVVGADRHPHVVDRRTPSSGRRSGCLRRSRGRTPRPVRGRPRAARRARVRGRSGSRSPAMAPSGSGYRGITTAISSSGWSASASRSTLGGVERPQVLVLEVDEASGAPERLEVGARDAALAVGRERVRASPSRIGAQHLDGERAVGSAGRRLGPSGPGGPGARRTGAAPARDRVAGVDRGGVVPPFGERERDVVDRRAAHLELQIVPGRAIAVVLVVELDGLRIAAVVARRRADRGRGRCRRRTRRRERDRRDGRRTIFWWWLPPRRTRWSSSTCPPGFVHEAREGQVLGLRRSSWPRDASARAARVRAPRAAPAPRAPRRSRYRARRAPRRDRPASR